MALTQRGVILGLGHHHACWRGHGHCPQRRRRRRKESREDGEETELERSAEERSVPRAPVPPRGVPLPVGANPTPGTEGLPATSWMSPLPYSPLPSARATP